MKTGKKVIFRRDESEDADRIDVEMSKVTKLETQSHNQTEKIFFKENPSAVSEGPNTVSV